MYKDGSAGDANYELIGNSYSDFRKPETKILDVILSQLGNAHSVLNVGAGTGSYEPQDLNITAVEPSSTMRAQRPQESKPAVDAMAEDLPFADKTFDASMSIFSIHQWKDLSKGLAEMRRVTLGKVILMSCLPDKVCDYWLYQYAPSVLEIEAKRFPTKDEIEDGLNQKVNLIQVPIPLNCSDGFNEAYYGRPEYLLNKNARQSCSSWSFVDKNLSDEYVCNLKSDIESGKWDVKYGNLRKTNFYLGSLYLFVTI
jgi:SAM-dependent methyltransferase